MTHAAFHTLPLHVGDLVKDTNHLTHELFGVFMRLYLAHFHLGLRGLPVAQIHLYARVTPAQWQKRFAPLLLSYFQECEGHYILPRLCVTLQDIAQRSAIQKDKALKRWNKSDAAACAEADAPEDAAETAPEDAQETPKALPTKAKTLKPITNDEEREGSVQLYTLFPSIMTPHQFAENVPQKWQVIAEQYGIEKEFLYAVAAGFWERFVGRYPEDPLVQEKFPCKKNWDKAWEFECDRLDRIKRKLPPRNDLPYQKRSVLKSW